MIRNHGRRLGVAALLAALGLALSACVLSPGKFVSSLDIRKSGSFAFAYKGEISMMGLAQIAAMSRAKAAEQFKPAPCYADGAPAADAAEAADAADAPAVAADAAKRATEAAMRASDAAASVGERKCTDAELARQKQDWEEQRAMSAEREKKELDQMKAVFGGLDPTDPRSIEEFTARLRRQSGWNAVTYKGDGLFEVDYALTGRLDHDFVFPIIERFPTMNTFVQVLRRSDGTVRVDAPGFVLNQASNPMMEMMGMRAMGGARGSDETMPRLTQIDGSFTVTTDGRILANNTDEGPQADPQGQKLHWIVNQRTPGAPTTLIRLGS